mmetsp:Transcript_123385/g.356650  ORF Transcript_123385/g.356650 Transcript_123385/m.356650 type:complete len:238 (+) Transcript_123385:645-1358(+)
MSKKRIQPIGCRNKCNASPDVAFQMVAVPPELTPVMTRSPSGKTRTTRCGRSCSPSCWIRNRNNSPDDALHTIAMESAPMVTMRSPQGNICTSYTSAQGAWPRRTCNGRPETALQIAAVPSDPTTTRRSPRGKNFRSETVFDGACNSQVGSAAPTLQSTTVRPPSDVATWLGQMTKSSARRTRSSGSRSPRRGKPRAKRHRRRQATLVGTSCTRAPATGSANKSSQATATTVTTDGM